MNYLQLVQRLRQESKRSGPAITTVAGLTGDDLDLVNWIADAWTELQRREHGWRWMRAELGGPTIIGQRGYRADELDPAASGFGRWLPPATKGYEVSAESAAGAPWPLQWLDWQVFRSKFELRESVPGAPAFWSIAPDERLYVGPTPDAEYTVRASFFTAPTNLSLDDDVPTGLPAEYHLILVWRALQEQASVDAAPEVYSRAISNFDAIDRELFRRFGPQMSFATSGL